MSRFQDKVVLVMGASSGMGRICAQALAEQGAHVLLAARRGEACAAAAEAIRAAGGSAEGVAVDVRDAVALEALFTDIGTRFGRLDGAFNNVGQTLGASPTHETPEARFVETLEINLVSMFRCLQHELKLMLAHGGGAIVNNSSIGGTRGFAGLQDYCASKAGVIGLSRAAALEYATSGIRINVVAPGLIATERFEEARETHAEVLASRLAEVPMRRAGSMRELAGTVCWLLSDEASYLTGAVLTPDGGECAR
ncbi:MAG: SDR family oxidoreductase [Gammaproteobacteria bacterium]|nr:SDR family oxidoreductase [Gammaproteobacteria bacterium]TVQ49107.1 MAG: SDR family oxidoreductase [Gammaproteobacteria bacterium]